MKKVKIILFAFTAGAIISIGMKTQTKKGSMKESENYKNGEFVNLEETRVMREGTSMVKVMREFMKKGENRIPRAEIATRAFDEKQFLLKRKGITFVWFGHSTVLLNIDGVTLLLDPFFGNRASPVSFAGSRKFEYSNDYSVSGLPFIDMVLISHNHYDHLDAKTIKQLKKKTNMFVVPLGVSKTLRRWKIEKEKIVELDWWSEYSKDSSITITATPARHFSGRGLKRNTTLWCSYVMEINKHKIFFSGDSGYGRHFKEIGEKFGSFDLSLMECGQYNENWPLIHMSPEETVKANVDIKGKMFLPLHWGKLSLSPHEWTDPVESLMEDPDKGAVLIPEIGQIVHLDQVHSNTIWWKE